MIDAIFWMALGGLFVYCRILRRGNALLVNQVAAHARENAGLRYLMNLQAKGLGVRDNIIGEQNELLAGAARVLEGMVGEVDAGATGGAAQ